MCDESRVEHLKLKCYIFNMREGIHNYCAFNKKTFSTAFTNKTQNPINKMQTFKKP